MVVAVAVFAAITLLPSILALLGTRINRFRVPGLAVHHDDRPHGLGALGAVHRRQSRARADLGLAILIVLAIPVFGLTLGQPDNGQLPTDHAVPRQSYDQMSQGFGAGSNGPALIQSTCRSRREPGDSPAQPRRRSDRRRRAGSRRSARRWSTRAATAALMNVTPTTAPSAEATYRTSSSTCATT